MSGPGLDKCSLISVFVESVLWGIFLLLYFITLYLLIQKRPHLAQFIPHLLLVTLMLVLCTMHIGLSFRRELHAFFVAPSPVVYLEDTTNQISRFKSSVHIIQIVMTDFLIVSRSFFLWDKNFVIAIFPCVLVAGTLAAGVGSLLAMSSSRAAPSLGAQLQSWMIAVLVLTIVTKTLCLLLVAFRVRHIQGSITSRVNRHFSVYAIMVVLVESGAVALGLSIALLPMFVAKLNAHYVVRDALSPVMGITFITIIAGMSVNLTDEHMPSVPPARSAWNRYSIPPLPLPRPTVPPIGTWRDFQDKMEFTTAGPSSYDGSLASPTNLNNSTGTLNMAIVL